MAPQQSADRAEYEAEQRAKRQQSDGTYYGSTTTGATPQTPVRPAQPVYTGGTPTSTSGYSPPPQPQPTYYGGTPTSQTGYAPPPGPPPVYTGGTPTAPYRAVNPTAYASGVVYEITDLRPEEDYSAEGAYQRALDAVEWDTRQEYYSRYGFDPLQPPNPREYSNILRARRANALRYIVENIPDTLDRYPTLTQALAERDLDPDEYRKLVNLAELDNAYQAFLNNPDPQARTNILLTMNPVQRAAFIDYNQAQLQEAADYANSLRGQMGEDWNTFWEFRVAPILDGLMWLNENSQQTYRALTVSLQDARDVILSGPDTPGFSEAWGRFITGVFPVANVGYAIENWSKVAPGVYDKEGVDTLRAEYGDMAVDAILRWEELKADGKPNPWDRWFMEYAGTPAQDVVRKLTSLKDADPKLLELASKVDSYNMGNTGMVALGAMGLPDDWRGSAGWDAAAATLNVVGTVALDPTNYILGGISVARSARYSLYKWSNAPGLEESFKMSRTRMMFDSIGDEVARMENLDPTQRAIVRDVLRRSNEAQLPPQVIDELVGFTRTLPDGSKQYVGFSKTLPDGTVQRGIRNADDAYQYFMSKMVAENILAGVGFGDKFGTVWEQIARASNSARRYPISPGKSIAGVARDKFRMFAALHNPSNRHFARKLADEVADLDDPVAVAQYLESNGIKFGADRGRVPRFQNDLLSGSAIYGNRYADRTFWARLDRFMRLGAKAPFPDVMYMADGRDAGLVYKWARSFLSRQDAAFISDVWRNAGSEAVRKQIFNGLVKTHTGAVGVQVRTPGADWRAFLPETVRGGTYSPTLRMRRDENGMFVWDRTPSDLAKVEDEVAEFQTTAESLMHGTTRNFETFKAGVPNRRNKQNSGVFYFTEDREVANRWGPDRTIAVVEPDNVGGTLGDFDYLEYVELDDAGKAAMDADLREYVLSRTGKDPKFVMVDPDTGDWVPATIDDLNIERLYDYEFGRIKYPDARVIETTVYGKTIDLVPPRDRIITRPNHEASEFEKWLTAKSPAELEFLKNKFNLDVADSNTWERGRDRIREWGMGYSHERDTAFHQWMRDNGYGKAKVVDAYESGFVSYMALPEMIAYGSNDPVAAFKASRQAAVSQSQVDDIVDMKPSKFGDNDLPLHLWQTSDWVQMPNFAAIEEAGVKVGMIQSLMGATHGKIAQQIVDAWSLLNLAGPRYFMRNAIEDYAFYAMTSGRFLNAYKGRRFSTVFREARGRPLGIVNRKLRPAIRGIEARVAGRPLPQDPPGLQTQWAFLRDHMTDVDKRRAAAAAKKGDLRPMRELIALAMARSKLTLWSAANEEDLLDFVTEHGAKLLDEAAEVAGYGASGMFPYATTGPGATVEFKAFRGGKITYPTKQWGDVAPQMENQNGLLQWQARILGAADRDGSIGKIVIGNLDQPDSELVRMVAQAIREDKVWGYKSRLAAFSVKGVSEEEFAQRYITDVRNLFARPDGSLNRELWDLVAPFDPARGRRNVRGWKDGGPTVSLGDLKAVPRDQRPLSVLGKSSEGVPEVVTVSEFDKWWMIMGEQYARFSREPVFLGNYLEQRRILRPYEEQMRERYGSEAARRKASDLATDRAYALMLSYTDNPMNRTILAWNARNVARYYRATEDFVRRVLRVGKNYPQGLWKVALTYDALQDTGFIYKDEYGEDYFVFPGSEAVLETMNTVMSAMSFGVLDGRSVLMQMDPVSYELRGYVKFLTPSADLNSTIPTFSSPIAALGVSTVTALFPQFEDLESLLLGRYSEGAAFWETALPGHVVRAWATIDRDERMSAYSAAFKDAVQVSMAAGAAPAYDPDNPERYAKEWEKYGQEIGNLATTMLLARFATGIFLPTSGRITAKDVTDYIREGGPLTMDAAWRGLAQSYAEKGSQNPWADAMTEYVETFGMSSIPFTMSTREAGGQFSDPVERLTTYQTTKAGEQWIMDNRDLVEGDYRTGALWLLPREGEYSPWVNQALVGMGVASPKEYDDFFAESQNVIGRWVLYSEMDVIDREVAGLKQQYFDAVQAGDTASADELWTQIRFIDNDRRSATRDLIIKDYPTLPRDEMDLTSGARVALMNENIRPMLDYIQNERDQDPDPIMRNMIQAVATFDAYLARINLIEGSTDAEDEMKRMLTIEGQQMLDGIAERDLNTRIFVDRILIPLMTDPNYVQPTTAAQMAVGAP